MKLSRWKNEENFAIVLPKNLAQLKNQNRANLALVNTKLLTIDSNTNLINKNHILIN